MVQVLAPRAGVAGMIATLFRLGVVLIDVVSGAGAITKYTVGPAWTGAEFSSINAAIAQAVADGHSTATNGTTVLFELYSTWFTENVVVPDTLPRWVMRGASADDAGTSINGSLTVNLPGAAANAALDGVEVFNAVTVNQPIRTANTVFFRADECSFFGGLVLNSAAATGVACRLNDCDVSSPGVTGTCRSFVADGGRYLGSNSITVGASSRFIKAEMGSTTASVHTLTNVGGFWNLYSCNPLRGRVNFGGVSCTMTSCWQNYAGSPAVSDACSVTSINQGNVFSHDMGPAGPAWVQTGTSLYHDGGNTYAEGQEYPWVQVGAGGRTDRAESDNELRRVLTRSGSPVLTPAEVGSQRKTTVAKVDGGGVVTLPLASAVEPGCSIVVKDLNGSATASPFSVAGQGGDLIDGAASFPVATNYEAVTFQQMSTTDWGVIGIYP